MYYREDINNRIDTINNELNNIEKEWEKECIKTINRYKTEYSMFCAMGSFAVYDKDNEPIDNDKLPKKLKELEQVWGDVVNQFNYYMTTEHIKQNR